jgi:hypothetical protein
MAMPRRFRDSGLQVDFPQTDEGIDMNANYTAVAKQDGGWWIGWIEEVAGVNCQEATRTELVESLRVTLREALHLNRTDAIRAAGGGYEEFEIAV